MAFLTRLLLLIALAAGLGFDTLGAEDTPPAAEATAATVDTPAAAPFAQEPGAVSTAEDVGFIEDLFRKGGWVMYGLAFLSGIAVCFILERIVNLLLMGSIAPANLVPEAKAKWAAGDYEGVRELGEKNGSILGQIFAYCAINRNASIEQINSATGDIASRELRRQHQANYWLAVVATIAPLCGLLGTITGMIKSFEVVATAGDIANISQVAGGISEALYTTATGLVIAVPALAAFHVFKVLTNIQAIRLEQRASEPIELWFGHKHQAA